MNKIVSASEFKAKCLRLIEEMQATGESITITKRGKVVAELTPKRDEVRRARFGMMSHPELRWDAEPEEPASDPNDWNALA